MNRFSLVVSDADGILITTENILTERRRAAVACLDAHDIALTISAADRLSACARSVSSSDCVIR